MPRSMTGYGRATVKEESWTQAWEVKSVNGRFLDIKWRLPNFLRGQEAGWEKLVKKYGSRGRVDIFLNLEVLKPELLGLTLNTSMAKAMVDQVAALASDLEQIYTPDLNRVLTISSLWQDAGAKPDPGLLESLNQSLADALESWDRSRVQEGASIAEDLRGRLAIMNELLGKIEVRVPDILQERITSLRDRINEMIASAGVEIPEDRMLVEIAVLTDRLDVSEELNRLGTHLERIAEVVERDGEAGKRLDFFLQEAFREINTCSNKCQDAEISALAVEFKAELEKCREQAQNIE